MIAPHRTVPLLATALSAAPLAAQSRVTADPLVLPAVSIPGQDALLVLILLGTATAALLLSALAGIRSLFAGPKLVLSAREAKARRHAVSGAGFGRFSCLALAALVAAEGFYAWKVLSSRDSLAAFREMPRADPAAESPISEADLRHLAGQAGSAAGPERIVLDAPAVDRWIEGHARFADSPGGLDRWAVVRTGVAVRSELGGLVLGESVRWLERDWLLTYEIPDPAPGVAEADVSIRVRLNGMPLPGRIGNRLWSSLHAAFAQAEAERRQQSSYQFAGMTSRGFVWTWNGSEAPPVRP